MKAEEENLEKSYLFVKGLLGDLEFKIFSVHSQPSNTIDCPINRVVVESIEVDRA